LTLRTLFPRQTEPCANATRTRRNIRASQVDQAVAFCSVELEAIAPEQFDTEWDGSEDGRIPLLVIDGREVSCDDLGRMLMSFEGWQLRLAIYDLSEEV